MLPIIFPELTYVHSSYGSSKKKLIFEIAGDTVEKKGRVRMVNILHEWEKKQKKVFLRRITSAWLQISGNCDFKDLDCLKFSRWYDERKILLRPAVRKLAIHVLARHDWMLRTHVSALNVDRPTNKVVRFTPCVLCWATGWSTAGSARQICSRVYHNISSYIRALNDEASFAEFTENTKKITGTVRENVSESLRNIGVVHVRFSQNLDSSPKF